MLRTSCLVLAFLLTSFAYADCNFKTGQYISQLKDPNNIQLIEINVHKSAKYEKNRAKIILSSTNNIPPHLKKKFKANISVTYPFGMCVFKGTIRQHGDWKDHINMLPGGHLYQSLNVKLETGNIVSAVRFKLLIPKTRNSENEILASLILKHLGIISPETFAVKVDVNSKSSLMLFQEDARKELLEKNHRRESAIFEGDEDLLWSFENFETFELENIALSRMINRTWFEKGSSSQAISLRAYSKLQSAYLDYATQIKERQILIISPNLDKSPEFSEYMFVLLAMDGWHALRPHNRKFYFNSITSKFEPIYYDGSTSFKEMREDELAFANELLKKQLKFDISPNFIKRIQKVLKSEKLKKEFIKRAETLNDTQFLKVDFGEFYNNAIVNYMSNIQLLNNKTSIIFDKTSDISLSKSPIPIYLDALRNTTVDQKIIRKLKQSTDGYIGTFQSGSRKSLSIKDISDIIVRNQLDEERTVFLGDYVKSKETIPSVIKLTNFLGKLTTSKGVEVIVSQSDKTMTFKQTNQDDWVLIQSGDLTGWNFFFYGVEKKTNSQLLNDQRFNELGLTGCLNFYESKFQNTKIEVVGGICEDSVNIVASKGLIDSITIESAFADALDIDFSKINISKVNIQNAGNDCLDFSSGSYQVDTSTLIDCADKGISVGEGSTFFAKEIKLINASIGVSSKDFSNVEILDVQIENSNVCIEVKQKKQEFGGAFMLVGKLRCNGVTEVDKNSTFKKGSF